MSRSVEDILREQIGALVIQVVQLQAEIEKLKEATKQEPNPSGS